MSLRAAIDPLLRARMDVLRRLRQTTRSDETCHSAFGEVLASNWPEQYEVFKARGDALRQEIG